MSQLDLASELGLHSHCWERKGTGPRETVFPSPVSAGMCVHVCVCSCVCGAHACMNVCMFACSHGCSRILVAVYDRVG